MRVSVAALASSLAVAAMASCALDWDNLDPRVANASGGGASTGGGSSGGAGGAPGGGGGTAGSGGTCPGALCDDVCVDLDSDLDHCGDCTTACTATEICVAGGCTFPASCAALLAARPESTDGVYTIAPDGAASFDAYCDMTTEGGGWTLVASVSNNAYFNGTRCTTACNTAVATTCDETPFTEDTVGGDVSTFLDEDHKSAAYGSVPFIEMLFTDDEGQYVSYDVSGESVLAWYPAGLENWVSANTEAHDTYSYPAKATNIDPMLNSCGTLRVSFNVEDSDSPVGGSCHSSIRGPAWARMNNGACYWDDAGINWAGEAFYGGNASSYRLWLVR